jgi:hypothetical protein
MNRLYIFVDSERPDQYINSMIHCILTKDVRYIKFIHINNLSDNKTDRIGLSGKILSSTNYLINRLSFDREYIFIGSNNNGNHIALDKIYSPEKALEIAAYYSKINSTPYSIWK